MTYYRVQGKETLVRDSETNAIVNTDYEAYRAYEIEYRKKLSEKRKIENLENELKDLKDDIIEIKNLLRGLVK